MLTVGILVPSGFEPLSLAMATVFEYANMQSHNAIYALEFVSEHGGNVRSSQGFCITTARLENKAFDTIIVLGTNDRRIPSPATVSYLSRSLQYCRRMASVCTGAFALAATGLLDGKRATTHWAFVQRLQKSYPKVKVQPDQTLVMDGQILTSAGIIAGIDMALTLVEKDCGPEVAKAVARQLMLKPPQPSNQPEFPMPAEIEASSDRIQSALAFAKKNLTSELSVMALARMAKLSPRQFSRVFREETGLSPAKGIEQLRVQAACLMLKTTQYSLETIARDTGFGDRERMRQSFLRAFGQSPQAILRAMATHSTSITSRAARQ